jgi:hypothetical protein
MNVKNSHDFMECDYRRGLDWWTDLLDSLIQRVTTLYSSLLYIHTYTSVHSHVFTSRCLVAACNVGCYPSSGFANCPRPQRPASNSNSSQQLSPSSSLTNSLTNSVTHQPILLNWLSLTVLLITTRHGSHRKCRSSVSVPLLYSCLLGFSLFLCLIVAVETCLFTEPLLSYGCCIYAYSTAVA